MEYLLIKATETEGEFSVSLKGSYKPANMATHLVLAMQEDKVLCLTLMAAVDAYKGKLTEGIEPVEVIRHGGSSGD